MTAGAGEYQPPQALAEKVKAAPKAPGCYLFSDRAGNIIYVGKAKRLHARVKSYFGKAARTNEDMRAFLGRIHDVAYRVTPSELDALMLEYRLIKQYKPWFNTQLKADKPRPFLRVGAEAPYATLSVTAARRDDGAVYYDCFADEDDVKEALALFGRVWATPQCGSADYRKTDRACLYHSMGLCMAPCQGAAGATAYAGAIGEIKRLFAGEELEVFGRLGAEMEAHAEALEFEKAAESKRTLNALRVLQRKGRRMFHLPDDCDTLIFIRPYREAAFSLFYAVKGAVAHRQDFAAGDTAAPLAAFLKKVQSGAAMEDDGLLAACLTEILADRLFVPLPKGAGAHAVEEAARAGCEKFSYGV